MEKHNVILITIDSLRADRLGSLGYHINITPNLDKIAQKGCLFSQAISVGSNTRISFPAIFTSTYPFVLLQLPDKGYMQIPRERKTITEILKERGYNTIALNSNALLTYYREYWRGFDICEDPMRKKKGFSNLFRKLKNLYKFKIAREPKRPYVSPEEVNRGALSLLKNSKEPFFLWVNYMSLHVPYYPPKSFLREISSKEISFSEMTKLNEKIFAETETVHGEDLSKIINLYDAEVKYVDYYIGEFIRQLGDIGINFNNTLFVITSDHGDELGEHGDFAHYKGKLYDELLRVPLIMVGPGLSIREIKEQVSLLSLPSTILSLTTNGSFQDFLGKDLIPIMKYGKDGEEYVISEGCEKNKYGSPKVIDKRISCRSRSWKFIYNEGGEEELYNLTSDPQEKSNLINSEKEIAEQLKGKILEHLTKEERIGRQIKEKRRVRNLIKKTK